MVVVLAYHVVEFGRRSRIEEVATGDEKLSMQWRFD